MAINTNPSFMSRLGGQMPGMVNAAAQQFGNPSMKESVAGSASLLGKQKTPGFMGGMRRKTPPVTNGIPGGQMPGQQIPIPTGPSFMPTAGPGRMSPVNVQAPGLVPPGEMNAEMPIATGPSPLFQNPYGNIFGNSPGYGRSGNTGIAGGMFNRPPGYERPNMGAGGTDIGGLFGRYNQLNQNPNVRY